MLRSNRGAARILRALARGACLLALTLAVSASASAQGADEEEVYVIQEQGGTYVLNFAQSEEDESMTLYQFVQACEQVTKLNFTWGAETEALLKNQQVNLLGAKTIKKERFYSFFQVMMIISDFVCTEIGEDDISVIKIDSLATAARNNLRAGAIYVEPERLAEYEDQPATLITTVVSLPNTDVRQVSNSMRSMITDPNTQQMLPAGNSQSMVLVGFGSNVVALANMLKIIDTASKTEPTPAEFDVIKLEYASAEDIAATVEELLEAANQARSAGPQAQGPQGAINRNQSEAKILTESRTNSLLVMALPEDMPRIKELVARLDVDVVERERNYHIYALENVSAEDLAETLDEFLQDAVQLEQGAANANQRGGAPRATGSAREYVVVADAETNSLLIAANRTRYEELESLIERLDRRQDQVLIETALIELTGQDFLDIGVELGFADIPGVGESGGFGVTGFGLSTITDSDGDGVPDLRVPTVGQGVTAGIIDGDEFSIPMLVALVEEKRNSDVLNVPSVLVNNNSVATVSTLDEQPTTQITATGGGVGGQTQENFNGYEEAGITMEISPSISASRYLRLDVYLEVSTFLGAVQGPIPPPRVTRTIETQINVPDGSTMVIGGIVVDNESTTRTQVPWLGDIPILGRLFSRETGTRDRTVLYFFVTPHILKDTEFADLAELSYEKKLEASKEIGIERLRKIDPTYGMSSDAAGSSVSLEGFDLPLYTPPQRGETAGDQVGLSPLEAARMLDDENQED
ncbi:MAG: secretin N-terminal domain-containing protein [Planctomycetota bacterium]|nr:secretin N-terminal domain-containing protein [Planctomycetota bacterium]